MVRITNVVATAHLQCKLDLNLLEKKLPMAFYNPREFSGLLMRVLDPIRAHCQVYVNGKITINGGRSEEESRALASFFAEEIGKCGFSVNLSSYFIVNLVGSLDFGQHLHLEDISQKFQFLSPKPVYCPELFPGLTLRLSDCTAVLFHSGKINLLGAKSEFELLAAEVELKVLL